MSEVIQFNRFSDLHNGKDIFFCKTDFLQADFDYIKNLSRDVILISGNSDYCITEELVKTSPQNIKKWFCPNHLSSSSNLISLPMGVENCFESKRSGHGVGWDFATEKNRILSAVFGKKITGEASNLIYANFNVNTNPEWRNKIKNTCLGLDYVTFKESDLSYPEFISDVISHEAIVCPAGNVASGIEQGGDNHRIYEVMYCNRTPIVFSENQNIMYDKIYKFLPIILLKDPRELLDKNHIIEQLKKAKEKKSDTIKMSYWREKILDCAKSNDQA